MVLSGVQYLTQMSHVYLFLSNIALVATLPLARILLQIEGISPDQVDKVGVTFLLIAALVALWRYFTALQKESKEEYKALMQKHREELQILKNENKELLEKIIDLSKEMKDK
jgi:hypothetical protein